MHLKFRPVGFALLMPAISLLIGVFMTPASIVWSDPPDAPAVPTMSPEQMDSLVAPIALYPDPLISQILVASTYPLELVEANQWLGAHAGLQGQDLKAAAAQQTWDPSVQALVLFPDVIKRLSTDVTWTTNLGNAFLANQSGVMDSIQRMRGKAEQAGKLTSTPQQKVTTATQSGQTVIEIVPANPEVIYVPTYNPVWIWGASPYYSYPSWYYPPPPPSGVWFVWGPSYHMNYYYPGWSGYGGWGGWGWRPHWNNGTVVVNQTFITSNHYNVVNVTTVNNASVWVHSPSHRMGVAYPSPAVTQRYTAPAGQQPMSAAPAAGQITQPAHQPLTTPAAPMSPITHPQAMASRPTTPGAAATPPTSPLSNHVTPTQPVRPTVDQVQQQLDHRAGGAPASPSTASPHPTTSPASSANRTNVRPYHPGQHPKGHRNPNHQKHAHPGPVHKNMNNPTAAPNGGGDGKRNDGMGGPK